MTRHPEDLSHDAPRLRRLRRLSVWASIPIRGTLDVKAHDVCIVVCVSVGGVTGPQVYWWLN